MFSRLKIRIVKPHVQTAQYCKQRTADFRYARFYTRDLRFYFHVFTSIDIVIRGLENDYKGMNKNIDTKKLQEDIDKLGIVAIETSGLSLECMQDAVDVVKAINIDFTKLAMEARKKTYRNNNR